MQMSKAEFFQALVDAKDYGNDHTQDTLSTNSPHTLQFGLLLENPGLWTELEV